MIKNKRLISICIVVFMFFNLSILSFSSNINLEQIKKIAFKKSETLKDDDIKIYEKKIAIKQAKKSVSDENKKNSRMFSKKPIYTKDFARKTKISKAKYEYKVAKKKKDFDKIKVDYKAEELYFKVYKNQELKKMFYKKMLDAKNRYFTVKTIKNISEKEIEYSKSKYEKYEKEYEKYNSEFQKSLIKLSSISSVFNPNTDNFNYILKKNYLSKNFFPNILMKSYEFDSSLFEMSEDIKYKLEEINVSSKLYTNDFSSSRMRSIKKLLDKNLADIDNLELQKSYENLISSLISRWGDTWKPYYEINLMFLSIKIPKLFRFGEFDGVRYLEDARYDLMLKIVKTKSALKKEKELKDAKYEYILGVFSNINSIYCEYQDMNKLLESKKNKYKLLINKFKNKSDDSIRSLKDEIDELEINTYIKLFDLNELYIELNANTNGYINYLVQSADYKNQKINPMPYEYMTKAEIDKKVNELKSKDLKIQWELKEVVKDFSSELVFKLDKGLKVDSYSIETIDGFKILDKTDVKNGFKHLNIVFSDMEDFIVKFYNGDKFLFKGTFDGYGSKGIIKLNSQ